MNWLDFWNSPESDSIYISDGFKEVYYGDLKEKLLALLPTERPTRFLDYGCGYALNAEFLAEHGIEVYLYDPSLKMREAVRKKYYALPNIHIVESLEDIHSIDVAFMFSVVQYLSKQELQQTLSFFKRVAKRVVIGDVVSREDSMVKDVFSLLGVGVRHGFFIQAFLSLAKTYLSQYRGIRDTAGFLMLSPKEMLTFFKEAGFDAVQIPNIGFNTERLMFTTR